MGFALVCIGAVIAWSPEGRFNPPRWLGQVGVLAGLATLGTWTFLVSHVAGGVFTLLGELGSLVMMAGLGLWFVRQDAPGPPRRS